MGGWAPDTDIHPAEEPEEEAPPNEKVVCDEGGPEEELPALPPALAPAAPEPELEPTQEDEEENVTGVEAPDEGEQELIAASYSRAGRKRTGKRRFAIEG